MQVRVRRVVEDDWPLLREVRLGSFPYDLAPTTSEIDLALLLDRLQP